MQGQYNLKSPGVKRLMREAQELCEPTEQYYAQPLDDNLFEWHFTIRGPDDTPFGDGIYHGRIILPPQYPMKPPSIMILTPNGRFETHKKICLSISGHHPESWQPSWSIRTALLAIIGFMPSHGNGAIGSLDYTTAERKKLAKKSQEWKCSECGCLKNVLLPVTEASKATKEEAKELAAQMNFQSEKERNEALAKEKAASTDKENEPPSASATADTAQPMPGAGGAGAMPPNMPSPYGAFNPQMFGGRFPMPPHMCFPPGMFRPQGMGENTTGMPPQMPPSFMPPFGGFPPMPPGSAPPGQARFGAAGAPQSMMWPPPWAMPPAMQAFLQQQQQQQQGRGGGLPAAATSTTDTDSASGSRTTPVVSTATSAGGGTGSATTGATGGGSSTTAATTPTSAASSDNVNASPATATETVSSSTSTSTSTTTSAASPSPTPSPSSSSSAAPSSASASSTTVPPTTPTVEQSALRQRQRAILQAARVNQVQQPAAIPRQAQRTSTPIISVLMLVITLIVVVLIIRRMSMMDLLDLNF